MFGLFKQKPKGTLTTVQIKGMHCTSCAMNIDGELEDLQGVYSASTNYAKSQTVIDYDSKQLQLHDLKKAISKAGYKVEDVKKK